MFKGSKDKPIVSIIIPCYNHENYVLEAIESIINQDYENIELIIIDDGSTDNSVIEIEKIAHACNERFKRFEFRSRPNKGLCATLNEALDWCEGEFFSVIASDDIALVHKTSFLVSKINNSNYAGVFGVSQPINELKEKFGSLKKGCIHSFNDIFLQINIPSAPAALLRKSSVINVGGYAEDVKLEDRYMWLSLTYNDEILVSFPEVVVLYRKHSSNISNNIRKMQEYRLEVLDKFKDSSLYVRAVKNSYLVCARELSNEEVLSPIIMVFKSRNYNRKGAFIVARSLVPSIMISFLRAWRSR